MVIFVDHIGGGPPSSSTLFRAHHSRLPLGCSHVTTVGTEQTEFVFDYFWGWTLGGNAA